MLCNVPEGCKAFFLTSDGKSVHALEHEDSILGCVTVSNAIVSQMADGPLTPVLQLVLH